jgi:hypothetical protein
VDQVRDLDGEDDPQFAGMEDLVHKNEVEALLGVAHRSTRGEEVTVIVYHVSESEGSEGRYKAVTMKGVPLGCGGRPWTWASRARRLDLPSGVGL